MVKEVNWGLGKDTNPTSNIKVSITRTFISIDMEEWMQNKRGYYDKEKTVVNVACKHGILLLVISFIQQNGMGWGIGVR